MNRQLQGTLWVEMLTHALRGGLIKPALKVKGIVVQREVVCMSVALENLALAEKRCG